MECRTNIGLFIVILLMWLSVCATAFCIPRLCPSLHTFCGSQGDMVQCFDKRGIDIYSMAYSPSGLVDTKYSPETGTDIIFGYTQGYNIGPPYTEQFRRHVWNETGQLAAAFGNEYCGYYAYDAQGNRAYKITGYVVEDQHNAGYPSYTAYFDDATMYVNPYMVVTPQGYTKHYYNGSQRIASRLGDYWNLEDPSVDAEDELATADSLWLHTTTIIEPSHQDMEGDYQYIQADGSNLPIVSYGPYISSIRGFHAEDILWGVFSGSCRADDDGMTDDGVFYYHPDHLGSTTWITSDRGQVVQYLHYMPFGELWESQQVSEYDERFKFTGKERDSETGYDYFGARYYLSLLGIWMSPDPFIDKNVGISSYAFCSWNPINRLDPNGMDDYEFNSKGTLVNHFKNTDSDGIYILNAKGERVAGLTLEYGTILSYATDQTLSDDISYDYYNIIGSSEAQNIFEFLAKNTEVEWGLFLLNTNSDNYITTSHQEKANNGISALWSTKLYNRSIRSIIHNHPNHIAIPSGLPGTKVPTMGDIPNAQSITDYCIKYGKDVPTFLIYDGKGHYVPYSARSTLKDFQSTIKDLRIKVQ